MIDDLLTSFRADVPLPDDATAQRIYERAAGTRRVLPRRLLVVITAALVGLGAVGAALMTIHGSATQAPPAQGGLDAPYMPLTNFTLTRSGPTLTSIAITLTSADITDATLALRVMREDGQVVFEERVPMTNTGSTVPDTAVSTWSGTLSPSDWAGGCQDMTYGINFAVYPSDLSIDDPFDSTDAEISGLGQPKWFNCADG